MTFAKHGAEDQAEIEAGARAVMLRGSTIGVTTGPWVRPGLSRIVKMLARTSLGPRFPFEDVEAIENWVDLEKVGRSTYCTWRGRRACQWRWTAFSFRTREQLGLRLIMV